MVPTANELKNCVQLINLSADCLIFVDVRLSVRLAHGGIPVALRGACSSEITIGNSGPRTIPEESIREAEILQEIYYHIHNCYLTGLLIELTFVLCVGNGYFFNRLTGNFGLNWCGD